MRMIDADALVQKVSSTTLFIKDAEIFQQMINDAPTIEPSDDIEGDIDFHCDLKHNRMTWFINITESPNDAIETDDEVIEQNALMSHEEAWEQIDKENNSADSLQVTGKLKNPCDSLLTEDSKTTKEQKSKLDHDREWIIGCIKHDGFIKTDRFDKANQIILDALEPSGDLISRADAINALSKDIMGGLNYNRILKELPSAVADGEDLIIKGAKGIKDGLYNIKDGELFKYKSKGGTVRTYPIVPSDDRPSGKWIHEETGWYGGDGYKCSACGYGYSAKAYHEPYEFTYCPNCGAKMGERENVGTDCTDFIHWISKVVADEELWELNAVGYGEIICRKLVKVGALATTEKPPYYYVPSVSAERSGEWIYNNKIGTFKIFTCSLCGVNMETDQWNYCPNCGARMESAK